MYVYAAGSYALDADTTQRAQMVWHIKRASAMPQRGNNSNNAIQSKFVIPDEYRKLRNTTIYKWLTDIYIRLHIKVYMRMCGCVCEEIGRKND